MTGFSPADRVYGDGTMPADADFIAPVAAIVEVRSSPGSQSGAESTTTTTNITTTNGSKNGGRMTDNADATGTPGEPDGKFTDEEFKDGSHTSNRAAGHAEEGEYTDSDLSETDKDHTEKHD